MPQHPTVVPTDKAFYVSDIQLTKAHLNEGTDYIWVTLVLNIVDQQTGTSREQHVEKFAIDMLRAEKLKNALEVMLP